MLKRTSALIATLTILLSATTSQATEYFIQITASPDKVYVDDGAAPGGVEIFKDNKFVSCALAFAVKTWDGDILAPFSYGFMSQYPLKELTFKPRGVLNQVELIKKETPTDE